MAHSRDLSYLFQSPRDRREFDRSSSYSDDRNLGSYLHTLPSSSPRTLVPETPFVDVEACLESPHSLGSQSPIHDTGYKSMITRPKVSFSDERFPLLTFPRREICNPMVQSMPGPRGEMSFHENIPHEYSQPEYLPPEPLRDNHSPLFTPHMERQIIRETPYESEMHDNTSTCFSPIQVNVDNGRNFRDTLPQSSGLDNVNVPVTESHMHSTPGFSIRNANTMPSNRTNVDGFGMSIDNVKPSPLYPRPSQNPNLESSVRESCPVNQEYHASLNNVASPIQPASERYDEAKRVENFDQNANLLKPVFQVDSTPPAYERSVLKQTAPTSTSFQNVDPNSVQRELTQNHFRESTLNFAYQNDSNRNMKVQAKENVHNPPNNYRKVENRVFRENDSNAFQGQSSKPVSSTNFAQEVPFSQANHIKPATQFSDNMCNRDNVYVINSEHDLLSNLPQSSGQGANPHYLAYSSVQNLPPQVFQTRQAENLSTNMNHASNVGIIQNYADFDVANSRSQIPGRQNLTGQNGYNYANQASQHLNGQNAHDYDQAQHGRFVNRQNANGQIIGQNGYYPTNKQYYDNQSSTNANVMTHVKTNPMSFQGQPTVQNNQTGFQGQMQALNGQVGFQGSAHIINGQNAFQNQAHVMNAPMGFQNQSQWPPNGTNNIPLWQPNYARSNVPFVQNTGYPNQNVGFNRPPLYRKPKEPDTFDGKSTDWPDYIVQFEKVAAWNYWDIFESAQQLVMSLRGIAQKTVSELNPYQLNDYYFLKRTLGQRFNPIERETAHRFEFKNRRKQKDESITDYGHALRRLATQAYTSLDLNSIETLVVEQFVDGVGNKDLKRYVQLLNRPQTLDQAISYAIEYEAFEGPVEKTRKPKFSEDVTYHTYAVDKNEKPNLDKKIENIVAQELKNDKTKGSEVQGDSQSDKITPNKTKFDSKKSKDITCDYCSRKGHIQTRCFKKKDDELLKIKQEYETLKSKVPGE